jgi:hypothetical protein
MMPLRRPRGDTTENSSCLIGGTGRLRAVGTDGHVTPEEIIERLLVHEVEPTFPAPGVRLTGSERT